VEEYLQQVHEMTVVTAIQARPRPAVPVPAVHRMLLCKRAESFMMQLSLGSRAVAKGLGRQQRFPAAFVLAVLLHSARAGYAPELASLTAQCSHAARGTALTRWLPVRAAMAPGAWIAPGARLRARVCRRCAHRAPARGRRRSATRWPHSRALWARAWRRTGRATSARCSMPRCRIPRCPRPPGSWCPAATSRPTGRRPSARRAPCLVRACYSG